MAHTKEAVASWRGSNAVDNDGERIGTLDEIYMDVETASPSGLLLRPGCSAQR
jgi:sporulation protein YlmC with PRC-barrel domain